jgi:hypothetical protein
MATRFAGRYHGAIRIFDANRRLAALTAKGDPLEMIARVVPFESFRSEIEAAVLTPVSERKSTAGRKPIDVMVMFRMVVLSPARRSARPSAVASPAHRRGRKRPYTTQLSP